MQSLFEDDEEQLSSKTDVTKDVIVKQEVVSDDDNAIAQDPQPIQSVQRKRKVNILHCHLHARYACVTESLLSFGQY